MESGLKLRWGILGCARISRRGLIPGIRDSTSGTLSALGSRDLATAHQWATEFGVPRAHGSYQAVLEDPDVDAVYIPLPNELHKSWVFAAADAGKHVLCEKPLALGARRRRAKWSSHCRSRGVVLMEAFMWRHQPRTHGLLKLVADGAIGELRLVRSSFSITVDPGDWRLDPARGGGSALGCRMLRDQHRPTLRRVRARCYSFGGEVRADGRRSLADGGNELFEWRSRLDRL